MENVSETQFEERLHRALRPVNLTPRQRQRHLGRLIVQGAWNMELFRQRRFAELGLIAGILLVAGGIALWQAGLFGPSEADNPAVAELNATSGITAAAPVTSTSVPTPDADATARANGCLVTNPTSGSPAAFGDNPVYERWYQANGIWASLPAIHAFNPTLSVSSPYWYAGKMPVLWEYGEGSELAVSGHSLDDPRVTLDVETRYSRTGSGNIETVLDFPEAGCWEITGAAADREMVIVINVLPFEDRPDVIAAYDRWQAGAPYGVPQSCTDQAWKLDDRTGSLYALFWLDGDSISISSETSLLWEGETNRVYWNDANGNTDIMLTGEYLADPSMSMSITSSFTRGNQLETSLTFPAAGCWSIHAQSPDASSEFTVYVYPLSEKPAE